MTKNDVTLESAQSDVKKDALDGVFLAMQTPGKLV